MSAGGTDGPLPMRTGSVPKPAWVLGIAGLLPFVACATALQVGPPELFEPAYAALIGYSVAILSFMGGVQWGLAMRSDANGQWLAYGASVVPALLGWAALLSPPAVQLPALAAGFTLLLMYDLSAVRRGTAPVWYRQLRWPLTAVVVVCLALA